MKAVFSILSLFLLLTACEKDNKLEVNNDNIAGEWNMTGFSYSGMSTTVAGGETSASSVAGTGRDINFMISFKANGTYTSSGNYTVDLSYEFGGQTFTQPYIVSDFLKSGTYELMDQEMTITRDEDGEISIATIRELSSEVLIFELQQTETSTGQGTSSTIVINGEFQLRRQ